LLPLRAARSIVAQGDRSMFVRCAYYVGTVRPEDQETFDRYVREIHMPMVAQWPRLKLLRLLRSNGQPYLGEAPRYYQCFELSFATQADMNLCMASPERAETRRISALDNARFKGLFQGEVHHINYEVTDFPTTA
jgi:uncharacterized protein (TIGR02118 family)